MAIKPVEIEIRATDKATPTVKGVAAAVGDIAPASQKAGAASAASFDTIQQGGQKAASGVKGIAAAAGDIAPASQKAAATSAASFDTMHQRGLKASDGIKSISEQLAFVQKALITFQGGGLLAGLIKDAAQTADEYNNLSARIKLATGEGEAFEQAMASVTDVSLRTNSSLQATGNLFAKLTDAGKSAGLSAQDAQSQALSLTESINQAVQLSGASAQASDAALTQLIQGLQGGVLRGDEFNSVMEQSPRLARALADGLSVTTGELRKMANEGQLTSEVVIGALKSQAGTLKSEFETLPATVGRAVQNLSTAWTVYVGEADKATGASRLAASAISALADNLDTIAGYLLDAGQAAAAFAALKLAQTFLGIGAAATASTVAITANTAAMTANSAASAGAAAGVGRFAAILGGLKTFSLLGIVTNFKDIGTAIGEAAAKVPGLFSAFREGGIAGLLSYKSELQKLAELERSREEVSKEAEANRIRMAQARAASDKASAESQFELSKAAQGSLVVFDELVAKGKTAGEAVSEIGKGFDLSSLPGIANAAAVLDKLAADGKISAEQFRQAWADALKGEDLQVFEVRARAALAGTARETERLAAVMDGTLREAIRRGGGDFDVLAGGMSKAARSAINDTDTIINGLDRLKAQGVDVGKVLELSLNKAVKTADSQAAIEALRARVEQVRKLLGDQVADGLLKQIEDQAKKAVTGVTELDKALKLLGVKTREDLQKTAADFKTAYETALRSGKLTAEQLAQAFTKYAEAAIAANGGVATETLKSEAAMRGLEIVTDKAGKTIVRAMGQGADAAGNLGNNLKNAAGEVQGLMAWLDRLEKRNAEVKSKLVTDKDGFSLDKDGKRLAMGGDLNTLTGITNFLKQAGLNEEQAKGVAREFADSKGNVQYFNNPGQIKYGGRESTISEALLKAAERITFGLGDAGGGSIGRTVSVNINTPAGRETVNTDEAGAQALVRSLQQASLVSRG